MSNLPKQTLSLGPTTASIIPEQENHEIKPLMQSATPIKKSADQYAQQIAILSSKATMALKSSTAVVKESHEIVDKITYLLQALPVYSNP